MGLLDDAIREHLELKRSAGGDASEVARLEREAFGAEDAHVDAAVPADAVAGVEPPEPESAEPTSPQAPPEPAPVDQPTRQFTLEEAQDAERREESSAADDTEHDELEETPDFLQETPEHDRLWFEQKPPKDFDF